MAWNESGNGKNPWERGRGDGPPDLDRILRDWQQRLAALFGRRGSGGSDPGPEANRRLLALLGVLAVVVWLGTGFYRVDEADRGVVLRFGKYVATTLPGINWHLPWPIERVEQINTNEIVPFSQQTRMLTADENIVAVDLVVQYRRADPVKFLFNVRDPEGTLRDVAESAIREVVGKNKLDFILLGGRAEIGDQTKQLIQQTLDEYGAGMLVTNVNLQDANFPSQVEGAVQDAIKAREDKERLGFEAQAYANDVLPRARGDAVRKREESEAYKSRVIADAEGEAARFTQLLEEYRKAPDVTRQRLYLETMEEVYGSSGKVLMNSGKGNNVLYLPVDKLLEQRKGAAVPGAVRLAPATPLAEPPQEPARDRDSRRMREGR